MNSFLERLLFPHMNLGAESSQFKPGLKTGFIYSMGMPEARFDAYLRQFFTFRMEMMQRELGQIEVFYSFERILTTDQRNSNASILTEAQLQQKAAEFQGECERAYAFGKSLAVTQSSLD